MRMTQVASYVGSLALALVMTAPAFGDCPTDPLDFVVRDVQNLTFDDKLRTAFLLAATRQQYDDASKQAVEAFNYGLPSSAALSYANARRTAELDAQASNFSYNRDTYINYLLQRVSEKAANAYAECIEQNIDKTKPGIHIWLKRKEGNFLILNAIWVGNSGQTTGYTDTSLKPDNLIPVLVPPQWQSGTVQQVVLRITPDADGFFPLSIGGQSASFVALRDPVLIAMSNRNVLGDVRTITSGGTSDGHSPFCQKRSITSCVTPNNGGYLIAGSGTAVEVSKTGNTGWTKTEESPQRVCIEFWAATGACETEVKIQGRASATERYPTK
jgi:hypothetical protein